MNQRQRVQAQFFGNVQGVGFRFTAQRIASTLGLVGYVRNLSNGNVEVVCEGSKEDLEAFLLMLKRDMSGYITEEKLAWDLAKEEFSAFEIRF